MANKHKEGLSNLSEDAKTIILTKKFKAKKKYQQWLELFDELTVFDESTDKLRKTAKNWLILFAVLSFASLFFSAIIVQNRMPQFLFIIPVAIFICLFIAISKYSFYKKVDIVNDYRITLQPVIEELKEDLNESGKIDIELNLGEIKSYFTGKNSLPPGSCMRVTEKVYKQPLFKAVFPLHNNSKSVIELEKEAHAITRTKRNYRGKIKIKTKWKMLTTLKTTIIPDKKLEVAQNANTTGRNLKSKVSCKNGTDQLALKVVYKDKSPMGAPERIVQPKAVMDLLFRSCTALKQSEGAV